MTDKKEPLTLESLAKRVADLEAQNAKLKQGMDILKEAARSCSQGLQGDFKLFVTYLARSIR